MPAHDNPSTRPQLLQRLRDRADGAAWEEFLKLYRPMIESWCRRRGLQHHDAEEVSAAVLGTLIKAMPAFVYDPSRSFRSWLRVVVANEVQGFWRRRQRHPAAQGSGDSRVRLLLEEVPAPPAEDLVDELSATLAPLTQELQRAVASVRRRLKNPRTWQAFHRLVVLEEPASAVAAALGMNVGAVYRVKNRVCGLIREEVQRARDPEAGRAGGAS
jgi:RNA polymerase sigma-70 factor (ECF subfamily)